MTLYISAQNKKVVPTSDKLFDMRLIILQPTIS